MDFWRAANVLARRKWLILLSTVVAAALTFGVTLLIGSKWQATVRLMVPQTSSFAPIGGKGGGEGEGAIPLYGPYAKDAAKDQATIYQAMVLSDSVLKETVKNLPPAIALKREPELLDHVEVNPENARLYDLQVTETRADVAVTLAHVLAKSLVKINTEINTQSDQDAVKLLDKQVKHAGEILAATRRRYDAVLEQYKVMVNPTSNVDLIMSRLKTAREARDGFQDRLADVQAQEQKLEAQLGALPLTVPVKRASEVDPLILELQKALDDKELALTVAEAKFGPRNPQVLNARTERDAYAARLKEEVNKQKKSATTGGIVIMQPNPEREQVQRAIAALKQQSAGYEAQIKAQDIALQAAQKDIKELKGVDGPLGPLAAEMADETETRSNLISRLNSAHLHMDATERANTLQIIRNEFLPPVNTTAGRTIKLMILAVFCAFLATSGLVIALDSIDRRLKTVNEAELVLPGRVLAAIPQPNGPVSYDVLARITALQPQSLHAEAYRFLGMHLLNPRGPRARSLMVLAAKAEQGSTSTVTNLGITLAQAGQRVVIVDANVRTPEIHQVFEIPNDFGFTDLLRDPSPDSWNRAVRSTTVNNLHVITSGTTPENPWELMRSPNLAHVSAQLHEIADYVLYDTPSALVFTDALNLAPVVDAAFLCVRALEPLSGAEQRLIELLEQANVTVLGNVVSHVPMEVVEATHNYQHYYMPAATGSTTPALPPGEETT